MTELEMKMTDWLATAIGLPDVFKNADPGPVSYKPRNQTCITLQGAGMIQATASDATFIAILSARARVVTVLQHTQNQCNPHLELENQQKSAGQVVGRCH